MAVHKHRFSARSVQIPRTGLQARAGLRVSACVGIVTCLVQEWVDHVAVGRDGSVVTLSDGELFFWDGKDGLHLADPAPAAAAKA